MRSQPAIPIQPRKPIPAEPSFPILESKLAPVLGRPGIVSRGNLLDWLEASAATPVVAVCAPAGYGKTVLAAAWAKRDPRPFVWLSIDRQDNDPAVLLTYMAVGLDRVEPIDPAVFAALASRGASITQTVLPLLGATLSSKALPVVVVLDDVQLLSDQEGLDAVAVLVDHLPPGSQLAVISRDELPLPVARWRAEGRLAELGPDDLAMDPLEAGRLLAAARVELPDGEVAELTRRTEGWPVALYLAALSIKAQQPGNGAGNGLSGRDRFLVDYLQSVLLSRLSPAEVQFLTRTSVLDRLSGPLCDAVLGTSGSAAVLASLERSNLLVVPLDRQREWYRYHQLFQELLRGQLERSEPELVRELTLRAAHWCQRHGLAEAAIGYAMDAGDADLVARGVEQEAIGVYRSGRLATVQRWFDWFDDHGLIQHYPAVAMLGAWIQALGGHAAAAERWADAADRGSHQGTLPDGSTSIDGWRALLRAKLCRHGVTQMRADAELALTLIPVGSPWRGPAQLLVGISHLLAGDHSRADDLLAEAVDVAEDTGATLAASVALAERAMLAIGRQDWQDAEALVEQARSLVGNAHLEDFVTSVVLYAVAARVAIHHGNLDQAEQDLVRAQQLRPQATHALPYYAVQARLELVRAYLALTDVAGARTVLREVDDLLRWRPDLGTFPDQANQLRSQLDHIGADAIAMSSLTIAERRLLPLLPTHHSFREIGQHLHLSQHTVKSQALSVYRKLGVSSRGQAIQRARTLGLLAA
ncbi:MAG: ATP-dependent transcriptional regulator, MalT-like, LuxR family [Actinomycetia bacterium]|jgi:LuxR family maltose regulon positive regulatory protein|nr:ATP-dependent transcriptional regulator, MalT-like, LuxR family [Actinomycetes bacterium]